MNHVKKIPTLSLTSYCHDFLITPPIKQTYAYEKRDAYRVAKTHRIPYLYR